LLWEFVRIMNSNAIATIPKTTAINEALSSPDTAFKRRARKKLGYSDRREVEISSSILDVETSNSLLANESKTKSNNQFVTDIGQVSQTVFATPTSNSISVVSTTTVFPSQQTTVFVTPPDSVRSLVSNPFSKLYVFGDSLSDQGNIFNITKFANSLSSQIPVIPSAPYFEGRFSNGPIWIDYLSVGLGLPLKLSTQLSVLSPSILISSPLTLLNGELRASPFFNGATTTQSVNFAFGGAQTGFNSGLAGTVSSLIPGVLQQVSWFINDHITTGKSADSSALYVVFAGGNDYLDPSDALQPSQSVTNIALSIAALYSQGARNFLIPNLPDLGITPRALRGGNEAETRLSNLAIAHNALLNEAIDGLTNLLPQSNFIPLDFFGLLNNIAASPSQLGLTNITDPSFDPLTGTIVGDPNAYLFWDEIHPTAVGHLGLGISSLVSVANSLIASDPISLPLGSQSGFDQNALLPDIFIPDIFTPTFNEPASLLGVPNQN
jgi:phospholipase/lecithinase/hemolysin